MQREKLETYLGKNIKVTLFDDKKLIGKLTRCDSKEWKNANGGYSQKRWYSLFPENTYDNCSVMFRSSHVKKIELI